jgi:predicted deacylase
MNPAILHQSSWATSALGQSIELFDCPRGSQAPLLFIGGVHGDEPEGVELAQKFLSWLQKNNNPALRSWILIPCLNVDGFGRKQRTNGKGVDLNRNFPSADWSPAFEQARYYPGPSPASEPEVQALCQLIETRRPEVIFHFHSWKPCVVYTGIPGKIWAERASGNSGYEVREDIGYPTPGSLGQYGWLNHQTPVICIEEQEHTPLLEVWPRFAAGLQNLLRLP